MNIAAFAKAAGLSTATVSRAFHEPDKIRPETRKRVLALAAKLRYYPNPSGRALVKGRHDVLGLVWPLEVEGAEAPFVQRVLGAFTRQLVANDLDLLICPVDRRNPMTLVHARRTLLRSRCDAWILLYPRADDDLIESLRASGKPVISFLGRIAGCPDWKWVRLNQRSWIADSLKRLRESGAQSVVFLGCRKGEPDHEERLAEFNRLAPTIFGNRFLSLPGQPPDSERLSSLLALGEVDAVIGVDADAVSAAIKVCEFERISVPKTVQIIGIDRYIQAASGSGTPASFEQPLDEMAACAVNIALARRTQSKLFEPVFVPGYTLRS